MPEFQMPGKELPEFASLDSFVQGYIEALFFTNSGDVEDEIQDETFLDFAPQTLADIVADCNAWKEKNAALLQRAYDRAATESPGYTETDAGRDYWYTTQGHGVGFWDRGLGDIGKALTAGCKRNDSTPYVGDDGKIYLE